MQGQETGCNAVSQPADTHAACPFTDAVFSDLHITACSHPEEDV